MIVWRNGEYIEPGGAVSAADRGYLVGDGVFETLLTRDGRPAFLAAHLARLRRGAGMLAMNAAIDEREIRAAIAGLTARLGLQGRAVCRMTVTRSGGARGLAPPGDAAIVTLIALSPAPPPPPHFRMMLAQSRRYSGAATNGFKCIGAYAANLIARLEAARAGAGEAVLLNEHGRAACASAANIFVVSGEALVTPPETEGAMPGVTRATIFSVAAEIGVPARAEPVTLAALEAAPLLITNSVIGAAPASMAGAAARSATLASLIAAAYERRLESEFAGPPA